MSAWKPGDVASVGGMHALYADGNIGPEFHFADGSVCRAEIVPAVGPLVVIDPEDSRAVECLASLIGQWDDRVPYSDMRKPGDLTPLAAMQAALREFANPTPPKCSASLTVTYSGGSNGGQQNCCRDEGHDGPHVDGPFTWTAVQP